MRAPFDGLILCYFATPPYNNFNMLKSIFVGALALLASASAEELCPTARQNECQNDIIKGKSQLIQPTESASKPPRSRARTRRPTLTASNTSPPCARSAGRASATSPRPKGGRSGDATSSKPSRTSAATDPQQLIRSDNPFNHPISILLFAPQVHDPLHDVDLLLHLMLYALALLLVVQGPQHLLEPAVFLQQSVNAGLVVILLGVALWLVGL